MILCEIKTGSYLIMFVTCIVPIFYHKGLRVDFQPMTVGYFLISVIVEVGAGMPSLVIVSS